LFNQFKIIIKHFLTLKLFPEMKKIKKLIVFGVLLMAFTSTAFSQVSATSNASATIVGPIGISNTQEMNFGNVAVSATGGTVVLTPAGARSTTGGVTLPATTGTVTEAIFHVTGADGYSYAITLPSAALTITSGGNTMTVDTFTSSPSGTGSLSGGSEDLSVGATLNVAGGQPAGTYTSATPFTVTVNYN
jgi:hypothetical protein